MQTVSIEMVSSALPHLIYMQQVGECNVSVTLSVLTTVGGTPAHTHSPLSRNVCWLWCAHSSQHRTIDTLHLRLEAVTAVTEHCRAMGCDAESSKEDASSMFCTLKLKAAHSTKESVTIYHTTRRRVPKGNNPQWLPLRDALRRGAMSCRMIGRPIVSELESIWKKRSLPNRGTTLAFAWRDWGKPQNTPVRIYGGLAEIRIRIQRFVAAPSRSVSVFTYNIYIAEWRAKFVPWFLWGPPNSLNCSVSNPEPVIQTDSFGGGLELEIKNRATICRQIWNLASMYLCRRGDNWVTEDVEICLPPLGDAGWHDAPCSRMLQPGWIRDRRKES
jgi:hypothetical protein